MPQKTDVVTRLFADIGTKLAVLNVNSVQKPDATCFVPILKLPYDQVLKISRETETRFDYIVQLNESSTIGVGADGSTRRQTRSRSAMQGEQQQPPPNLPPTRRRRPRADDGGDDDGGTAQRARTGDVDSSIVEQTTVGNLDTNELGRTAAQTFALVAGADGNPDSVSGEDMRRALGDAENAVFQSCVSVLNPIMSAVSMEQHEATRRVIETSQPNLRRSEPAIEEGRRMELVSAIRSIMAPYGVESDDCVFEATWAIESPMALLGLKLGSDKNAAAYELSGAIPQDDPSRRVIEELMKRRREVEQAFIGVYSRMQGSAATQRMSCSGSDRLIIKSKVNVFARMYPPARDALAPLRAKVSRRTKALATFVKGKPSDQQSAVFATLDDDTQLLIATSALNNPSGLLCADAANGEQFFTPATRSVLAYQFELYCTFLSGIQATNPVLASFLGKRNENGVPVWRVVAANMRFDMLPSIERRKSQQPLVREFTRAMMGILDDDNEPSHSDTATDALTAFNAKPVPIYTDGDSASQRTYVSYLMEYANLIVLASSTDALGYHWYGTSGASLLVMQKLLGRRAHSQEAENAVREPHRYHARHAHHEIQIAMLDAFGSESMNRGDPNNAGVALAQELSGMLGVEDMNTNGGTNGNGGGSGGGGGGDGGRLGVRFTEPRAVRWPA